MKAYLIESYHYCDKKNKEIDDFYRRHKLSEEENEKSQELMLKLNDFLLKTSGEENLGLINLSGERDIYYAENLGYISVTNYDKDDVDVYGYGKTLDEAFLKLAINLEFTISQKYELDHRDELKKQYSERFLNGSSSDEYYGPLFFAELALQDFRKYYGDNIPKELISYYENYLKEVLKSDYKYDYETNSLVKPNEKQNILK